jgi:hypothetical protein
MNGKGFATLVALLAAALLGVATAAYSNDGTPKEPARTDVSTVRADSPCTMAHKCANPACKEAGYGTDDCYTPATTGGATTTESPCTRAHPCANPACKEAGYGTDDCYTPATTVTPPTTPPAEVGATSGAPTPPAAAPTPVSAPSAPAVTPSTPSTAPTQGVAGAHVQIKSSPAHGGVLGATHTVAAVPSSQTLPFTGLSLWQIALAGGLMLLGGVAMMRLHRGNR